MFPRLACLVVLAWVCCLPSPVCAEEMVWLTGHVFAADGKSPLAGAVVAVYDDKNCVVDYAKTDDNGEYTLAVPRGALHLNRKGGGFFHQVVHVVGDTARIVTLPLKAGIKAAASVAYASDPITRVGIGTASNLAQSLLDMATPGDPGKKGASLRKMPGVLVMKVAMPGHNDAVSLAQVYWLQEEVFRAGGKEQRALTAWVDPAHLTDAGSEKPSAVRSPYLVFANARLEPSIAEPGQTVTLTVNLPSPPEPRTPLVVVARNSRNGFLFELSPIGEGRYRSEFVVDKRFPKNDQVICVLAYAQQDDRLGRDKRVEDAINGAGLWNPGKPFVYNPLLVVSRNRAEVVLTVVQPVRR
jgi:hypothetical protein